MCIRVYLFLNFCKHLPLSYTTASVQLMAHLQAFAMVALGREAIISMIFNIRALVGTSSTKNAHSASVIGIGIGVRP
jgi:hypothetical protein